MKVIKKPLRVNKSLAVVIPDAIVKMEGITEKTRLIIVSASYGFKVRVRN